MGDSLSLASFSEAFDKEASANMAISSPFGIILISGTMTDGLRMEFHTQAAVRQLNRLRIKVQEDPIQTLKDLVEAKLITEDKIGVVFASLLTEGVSDPILQLQNLLRDGKITTTDVANIFVGDRVTSYALDDMADRAGYVDRLYQLQCLLLIPEEARENIIKLLEPIWPAGFIPDRIIVDWSTVVDQTTVTIQGIVDEATYPLTGSVSRVDTGFEFLIRIKGDTVSASLSREIPAMQEFVQRMPEYKEPFDDELDRQGPVLKAFEKKILRG